MSTVRANENFAAITDAGVIGVTAGQPFEHDDPIVKGREHLFTADNTEAKPRRGRTRSGVEQATAAPGELRDL